MLKWLRGLRAYGAQQRGYVINVDKGKDMPDQKAMRRAEEDRREGKSPSTQAGEFIREEMHHIREGKHGARSTKQAIAIGLSEARRAGVKLPPPRRGTTSEKTRRNAERAYAQGQNGRGRHPSRKRSGATLKALKREGRSAASRQSLSRQARSSAQRRGAEARAAAGRRAAKTRSRSR